MAEPIEMSWVVSSGEPRNHVLDGGPDPLREGAILRGEKGRHL